MNLKSVRNKIFARGGKVHMLNIAMHSLWKYLLIVLILNTLVLALVINYNRASLKLRKDYENKNVAIKLVNINTELNHAIAELKILSESSAIRHNWNRMENHGNIALLSQDFLTIMKNNNTYDQIRLIDESGRELIRVNYNEGAPSIVAENKLQNKKHRYYFKEAIVLDQGEIYMSPLDLNMENGAIEQPLKPMIRMATPVFDTEGRKRGIVIFNYLGQQFTDHLEDQPDFLNHAQLMLINADGYYLKASNPALEWGFMYENKSHLTFQNSFGKVWDTLKTYDTYQLENEQGLFTCKTVNPFATKKIMNTTTNNPLPNNLWADYYWKIVSFIPKTKLYHESYFRIKITLLVLFLLSLLGFIFTLRLIKAQYYRAKSQEALKESEQKNSAILLSIPDMLFITNLKGDFLEWYTHNPANLFVAPDKILGANIAQFFSEKMTADLRDLYKKSHQTQEVQDYEYSLVINKESKYFEAKIIAYQDDRILNMVRDVTKNKLIQQVLVENETQMRELTATKEKLFSIVAHDLRNPFNAILGFSELLLKKFEQYDEQKKKGLVNLINSSMKNTYHLLENLLLWSNAQSGSISLNPKKIKPRVVAEEVLKLLSNNAFNKGLQFKNDISADLCLVADYQMLSLVIRNLVSNAIKFTQPGGTIKLSSKIINSQVEIAISDNGVGMDAKAKQTLFNQSAVKSNPGTANERGSGLGLMLCKDFVGKLGGSIQVASEVGKGTTFTFTLPMDTVNQMHFS